MKGEKSKQTKEEEKTGLQTVAGETQMAAVNTGQTITRADKQRKWSQKSHANAAQSAADQPALEGHETQFVYVCVRARVCVRLSRSWMQVSFSF